MAALVACRFCPKAFDWDLLSRNSAISASVQQGECREALHIFKRMLLENFLPDKITLVSLFSAFSRISDLAQGRFVHALARFSEWDQDVVLGTSILTMYGKSGSVDKAQRVFDFMPYKNLVSWNAIITTFVRYGDIQHACELFGTMLSSDKVQPNRITLLSILEGCTDHLEVRKGKKIHDYIIGNGLDSDTVISTSIMNMYGKCNYTADALKLFDTMPDRDVVSWSSIISLSASSGYGNETHLHFQQMLQEGLMPDKVTFMAVLDACTLDDLIQGIQLHACIENMSNSILITSLIGMYGKFADIETATNIFDATDQLNVVSWNAIITAFTYDGKYEEASQLFQNMLQLSIIPNSTTFVIILDVCAGHANLEEGRRLHVQVLHSGVNSDSILETSLVNMYGKCGDLQEAYIIFERMERRNTITWTTIIAAFAHHGDGLKAAQLFDQMQHEGVKPDTITFISILSACRHSGLVNEASHWFNTMKQYGIKPVEKHYECLIDLLGKAGQMDEMEELIGRLPYVPTSVTWTALLHSCRTQVDVERGEKAANSIFRTETQEPAPYVILSSIYAASGRGDQAEKIMLRMKGINTEISSNKINTEIRSFSTVSKHVTKDDGDM